MEQNLRMFLIVIITAMSLLQCLMAYNTCTSRAYDFVGYTFKVDRNTSEKVWTHCMMPNPVYDPEKCGRVASDTTNYVCDPDYLMDSVSQGESIDLSLYNIQTNTSTVCVDNNGEKQSFLVATLLINRIRMPDFQSPDLCVNDCGEFHPELDKTARTATAEEEDRLMEHFADQIRELWGLGACDNDVIIFYCQELNKMKQQRLEENNSVGDSSALAFAQLVTSPAGTRRKGKVHISIGARAKDHVSDSKLSSLTAQLQSYIDSNRLEEGLLYIADQLRVALRGTMSPAEILLVIGMSIVVLFGLFLTFVLYAGDRDLNVWGSEQPAKTFEWIVYLITGVWLIKATMMFSMMVSHKFPYWGAGVCFGIALIFFALYVLDVTLLGDTTLLTTSTALN